MIIVEALVEVEKGMVHVMFDKGRTRPSHIKSDTSMSSPKWQMHVTC